MPDYDILVDKYISMGYPVDKAEDYATLDWMEWKQMSVMQNEIIRELIQRTLGMAVRRRVA